MSLNGLSTAQQAAAVTPLRPARARDTLMPHTPASSSSSLRPGPSGSASTSTPSPIGTPRTPFALDALLEAHAGAPSPAHAALEAAIADRNAVAAENTALWQRLARMRDELADAKRERDRYRGERNSLRSRLHASGDPTDGIAAKERDRDRRLKPSASAPGVAGATTGRDSPSVNGRLAAVRDDDPRRDESPARRSPLSRHHSEDESAHNTTPGPAGLAYDDAQDASASQRPTPRPERGHPAHGNGHPHGPRRQESHDHSRPSHERSRPSYDRSRPSYEGSEHRPDRARSPPTLIVPDISQPAPLLPPIEGLSGSSPDSPPETARHVPLPHAGTTTTDSNGKGALAPHPVLPSATAHPSALTPGGRLAAPPRAQAASRESQVPLPDEARMYISSMVDSPIATQTAFPRVAPPTAPQVMAMRPPPPASALPHAPPVITPPTVIVPSPVVGPLSAGTSESDRDISYAASQGVRVQEGTLRAHARPSAMDPDSGESQFLDLDDESGDDRLSADSHASGVLPRVDPAGHWQQEHQARAPRDAPRRKPSLNRRPSPSPTPSAPVPAQSAAAPVDDAANVHSAHMEPSHEDDPTHQINAPRPILQADDTPRMDIQHSATRVTYAEPATQAVSMNPTIPSSQDSSTALSPLQERVSRDTRMSWMPTTAPAPAGGAGTYRTLPLLASDLPSTVVNVVASSIKPNDRGKDVLSFVISVEPGRGKPGWRVEKLYSDVLGLDHRVRGVVGKSATKKITSLPEGKLWRDHAPARVDQRKVALEAYLSSLIALPVKSKDEIIAFLTSDVVRVEQRPVFKEGCKEGYLTKRGKNFGGWKTRYFVLQGPMLEYYESRGGTHLGSISITGAQIGRQQQRTVDRTQADDDNDYRHAFLVIEAKKGPAGASPRHVLCAESDDDRDSWVDVLVRYVNGVYDDGTGHIGVSPQATHAPAQSQASTRSHTPPPAPTQAVPPTVTIPRETPRSKTSMDETSPVTRRAQRGLTRDDIVTGQAVPLAQLTLADAGAGATKLLHAAPYPSSLSSSQGLAPEEEPAHGDVLPASLPASSPLDDAGSALGTRSASELGWYGDMRTAARPQPVRQTSASIAEERPRTPENPSPAPMMAVPKSESKPKISGPFKGAPIPAGLKFGAKEKEPVPAPVQPPVSSDRREKTKSRSFWNFGKSSSGPSDKAAPPPLPASAPVFGVPIESSLAVAEIAGLPAVLFRCIQFLEAKNADEEEGIYRLSGSSAMVKTLKDRFNNEGDVDLLASDDYWDPHAIAGLLKSYLRELPASLLTHELHSRFLAVMDFVDATDRVRELSDLIAQLPVANYSLLRALTAHLIRIVQNAAVNKMTVRNVGIVFSPTLGIPAGVFSLMLGEFTRVFNVNDAAEAAAASAPENTPEPAPVPERPDTLDRRNSKRYTDNAADQLLGLSGRRLASAEDDEDDEDDDVVDVDDQSIDDTTSEDVTDNLTTSSHATSTSAYTNTAEGSLTIPPYGTSHARTSSDGSRTSKAQYAAQARGLTLSATPSADLRARRGSRMPGASVVGLPSSPRPGHHPSPRGAPSSPAFQTDEPVSPSTPQQHRT